MAKHPTSHGSHNRPTHGIVFEDERLTAADKKVLTALASKVNKTRFTSIGSQFLGTPEGRNIDPSTPVTGPRTQEVTEAALAKFRRLQSALEMGDPQGEIEQLSRPKGVSGDLLTLIDRRLQEEESGEVIR